MPYNTSNFETEIQTRMDAVNPATPYEELAYLAKIEALQDDAVYVAGKTLLQRKTYTSSVAAEPLPANCNMVKIWATAKGGKSTNYGSGGGGGSVDGFEMEVIKDSTLANTYGSSHIINALMINTPLLESTTYGQLGGTVTFNGIQSTDPATNNGGNGHFVRGGYPTLEGDHDVALASGLTFYQGITGSYSLEYGGGASGVADGVDGDKLAAATQYGAGASLGQYGGSSSGMGSQSDIVIEFYEVK